MTVSKRSFGCLPGGEPVSCWTLTNDNGLQVEVLDYGVIIRSVLVPDKNGNPVDVVLGYDTLEEYVADDCYLGATVGRCANRIKGASFGLNGKTYELYANNGPNHLHGGKQGFGKHLWTGTQTGDAVVFSRLSPDGEEGYPGNLHVQVSIGWEGNSLTIRYEANTDQDTVVNLTNHSYFNLNGAGNGRINRHLLEIKADSYTPAGKDGIPTGEIASVEGTAKDFRNMKPICRGSEKSKLSLYFFDCFDCNFVIDAHPFAKAVGDKTGITMIADTDRPGVQLYTSNALSPRRGKRGTGYGFKSAFCLETQSFPDSIHHPDWPSCILRAGETFRSFTTYTFL